MISASTRQLLGTTFELEDMAPLQLKGFADDVYAWAVRGESATESRFEAVHGRNITRLIGRESELALLDERWRRVRSGEGQVVLISGEAGIGKSRMIRDFRRNLDTESPYSLYYQCSPHHVNSAFYPVIQRLQRAAGFSGEDDPESKLDKLELLLRHMKEDVDATAPLFSELLSLPTGSRYGPLNLTPQQLRHRTIEALVRQALTLSGQRTVLFILEDAHWVDPSMSDFISELLLHIADRPVLVLISHRPEYFPPWTGPHISSVALNRLGREQAAEIAHAVGGGDLLGALIERIVMRADGIPLYIEELTRSVLEIYTSQDVSKVDGLIPATLQSSLVARLDRLGEAKEMAQIGAVIGRDFSYDLLAGVSGCDKSKLDFALGKLVQSGLVYQEGTTPDATYSFKHSLVQDAAYNTILLSRRKRLHARIVEVLERSEGADTAGSTDLLAHHAFQAELWEKAGQYLHKSGVRAMDRAEVREAVAKFENALTASSHLPESREGLEKAVDLRFELRNGLWSIAEFEAILINLKEAERMARKLDDPGRLGWISVFNSASHWQIGRALDARTCALRALEINESHDDISLGIGGHFYLGCTTVTSGQCREAERLFRKIVDMTQGSLSRERCGLPFIPAVVARSWLVWAMAERGEFEAALEHGQTALEIAEEVGHPFNLAHIHYDLGYLHGVRGALDQAVHDLQKAHRYIREWNLTYLSPFITGFLGHATARAGQVDDGLGLLRQAVSEYSSMGLGLFRSLVTIQLGEALHLAGHAEHADRHAQRGLKLARKRGEQGHEAHALYLLGEISRHHEEPDLDAALEYYRGAQSLAESLEMRPLIAHCHAGIGRIYESTGHEKAPDLQGKATEMYRDLGMHHWLT